MCWCYEFLHHHWEIEVGWFCVHLRDVIGNSDTKPVHKIRTGEYVESNSAHIGLFVPKILAYFLAQI